MADLGDAMRLAGLVALVWAAILSVPALAATTTFEYDALGRLVKASRSTISEATYSYDAAGNRTQKVLVGAPGSGSSSELIPSQFTKDGVSTGYYYNNDPAVLRDGRNNDDTTSIGVYIGWVKMDLGSVSTVTEIQVLPIVYAYQGWGAALLNGAIVEYSTDDLNWTSAGTISGATETAYKSIPIGAPARYIRISSTTASANQLGIGDFRAYGTAIPELIPSQFTKDGVSTGYYYNNDPAVLRDGRNNDDTTSIGVYIGWVKMDLGSVSTVTEIQVLPIVYAYQGWGAALLNGAIVEYSTDDLNWTSAGTISGATETAYKSIPIGAPARYIRISSTTASANQLGLGDFRAYGY